MSFAKNSICISSLLPFQQDCLSVFSDNIAEGSSGYFFGSKGSSADVTNNRYIVKEC